MQSIKQIFTSLLLVMLTIGMLQVKAQTTTTRFNDGYLTVFRQSAPTGSSFTLTGTTALSTTINMASTTGIAVGMSVAGTGTATNAAVVSIVPNTSITVSLACTATGTVTLTFNSVLTTAGTAIYLDEYHPSTTAQAAPNYTVTVPSSGSTGIVAGGTTASNGAISRSENGRYILVPGFSTGTGGASLGAANTTNTLCAIRPTNGSGTIGTGITGTSNWYTAANDYRGAVSDDLSNYWLSGGTLGVRTTTNGTSLTTVSSTTTNVRAVNTFNGQLYYSTGSGTQGVYQVGLGKPITTGQTSVNLTTSTGAYGFSISPDFLTFYTLSSVNAISRWTYSGAYNTTIGVYSGGSWSAASTGFTLTAATGVAVDWSGYSFNTGANGAVIYACNSTTLVRGADNGTGAITTATLRTLTGLNTFKQLAFSPIKQTVSLLSASTPATGNLTANTTDVNLFAFVISADEGNSTMKKVIVHQNGSAVLGTDITSLRLVYDANGNNTIDAGELSSPASTGTVTGSDVTFSIASPTYISQGNTGNYFVVGNVSSTATVNATLIPTIVSNKTLNSVNYTTNLVNAGGSYVNMGTTVPTGNTLTIVGPPPTIVLSSASQISAGSLTQGSTDQAVSNFQAAITTAAATLNSVTFTIGNGGGSYTTGDVTNFKLWYNATANTFSGASQIGSTINTTASASGATVTFTSLGQSISNGNTGNFWITASINGSAVPGDKFNASIPTLTFASGTPSGSIAAGGAQTILLLTPTISLANGTIGAATITENTTNNVLYRADVTVSTTNAILNSASFVTAGTYNAYDVSNFKLWYSTSNTFSVGTSTLLGTLTTSLGAGTQTFSSLSQTFTNGTTAYLYVTTNLPCGSFNNATININAITNSSLTFASGTPTGSGYTAGGTQTMSSTTNAATAFASTNGNANSIATWTAPTGCYNEVMIVVAPASNTGAPSGDGTTYTANLTYGSGTALGNGYVAYKGTTSSQTITGLTNGATYYVKIFTRNGTNWTGGPEVTINPNIPNFTAGNLAVEVIGDPVNSKGSFACQVNVWEFNATGTIVNQFPFTPNTSTLPTSSPFNVTASANATSEGNLNLSADGTQILVAGYNAIPITTTGIATSSSTTNLRVLATLSQYNTQTTNANNIFNGNNIRSIASNGYSYWIAGTPTGGAGLYYLFNKNSTPVSMGSINTRVVKTFNKNLYYSSAVTGNVGIFQVGTNGYPINPSTATITKLTPSSYTGSPYGFVINATDDIMYVADDGTYVNSSTKAGGILKFTKVSGVWTYQYTLKVLPTGTLGARGLEVDWSGANPIIYCSSGAGSNTSNDLVKITDAGSTSIGASISTASSKYVYRGVQFAPQDLGTPTVYCTSTSLSFGGQPQNSVSDEQSFNVSGNLFSGNILVTAPSEYGVSLTTGGPYTTSVTINGGAPANATIYMVFMPSSTASLGAHNGNLVISASGASNAIVPITGSVINPIHYYNAANTDLTNPLNWFTNANGTGSNPTDFTTDGQYFNLVNAYTSLTSSQTTAALSLQATTTISANYLTFSANPTCPQSPASLYVGATITGAGIPANTTITAINGTTFTISNNATASGAVVVSVPVNSPWTISGTLSKLIVGDGTNAQTFTIPASYAYIGTVDVKNNATLLLQNNTMPTFGTLDLNSTVNYNQTGAASVVATTYGNLTLQGSTLDVRTLPYSSNITFPFVVNGDFTADNVTVNAQSISPYTFMTLGGDYTMLNGAVMVASTPTSNTAMLSVITSGNGIQTFTYTNGTIRLLTLNSTKSAGGIIVAANTNLLVNGTQTPSTTYGGMNLNFSGNAAFTTQTGAALNATGIANINLNFTGTSTFTLGGNLNTSDNSSASFGTIPSSSLIANFASTASFVDGGNTITVSGNLGLGGSASAYNLTGSAVIATRTGTSTIGDNLLTSNIVPTLNNFTFAPIGGTATTFAGTGNVNIANDFTIGGTATTNKISGGSNTIIIGGDYADSRTVDMISAGTTTWKFNGTSAQTFSTAYASGESFSSVELNNTTGLTMTTGDMKIGAAGTITCTSGILTTGTNKVILNATASVVETSSNYILGNVQTTRTLTTATESFGNLGLVISGAISSPGATTVLRNTGTNNNIGCASTSVKRTFTVTNSATSLNANLAFTFVPANELNGLLPQSDLLLYNNNTAVTGSSIIGNVISVSNLSSIAGVFSATLKAPAVTASSVATSVCSSPSLQNSSIAYSATTGNVSSYNITWGSTALAQGFINTTNVLSASPFTFTVPANSVANTYSAALTVQNSFGCSSTPSNFTLVVNSSPTAVISGNQNIKIGDTAILSVVLSGVSPWSFTLSDGSSYTNVTTSPYSIIVIPTTTTTYTITSLSNSTCNVTGSGSAVVTVNAINDDCNAAITLNLTAGCQPVNGTTFNAHASIQTSCTPSGANPDDDVWYKILKPANIGNFTVQVSSLGNFDAAFEVFSGTCGSLTPVSCINTNSSTVGNESSVINASQAALTYYVRVYDARICLGTGNGNFTVCTYGVVLPVNDNPCTAYNFSANQGHIAGLPTVFSAYDNGSSVYSGLDNANVTSNPPSGPSLVYFTGNNVLASSSAFEPIATCQPTASGYVGKTVWYKFRAPTFAAGVTIRSVASYGQTFIPNLAVFAVSGGSPCNSPTFTEIQCSSTGVLAINASALSTYNGQYIYLQVQGSPTNPSGSYTISIQGVVPNISLSNPTSSSIRVNFPSIASPNIKYSLYWQRVGNAGVSYVNLTTVSQYTINGLISGSNYKVWVKFVDLSTANGSAIYSEAKTLGTVAGCNVVLNAPTITPVANHCARVNINFTNPPANIPTPLIPTPSTYPIRVVYMLNGTNRGWIQAFGIFPNSGFDVSNLLINSNYSFYYSYKCIGGAVASSITTQYTSCNGPARSSENSIHHYSINNIEMNDVEMEDVLAQIVANSPDDTLIHEFDLNNSNVLSGFENVQNNTLSIVPNPATDMVQINFGIDKQNSSTTNISIINLEGKMIYQSTIDNELSNGKIELNIEDYQSGIYLVTVKSATINETKKMVITH